MQRQPYDQRAIAAKDDPIERAHWVCVWESDSSFWPRIASAELTTALTRAGWRAAIRSIGCFDNRPSSPRSLDLEQASSNRIPTGDLSQPVGLSSMVRVRARNPLSA